MDPKEEEDVKKRVAGNGGTNQDGGRQENVFVS